MQKRISRHRLGGLALILLVPVLAALIGCGSPVEPPTCGPTDECDSDSDCASNNCLPSCLCEAEPVDCATLPGDCATTADCSGPRTCEVNDLGDSCDCACPASSACETDPECSSASGAGTCAPDCTCVVAPPPAIPPNTTDCTVNMDGSIEGGDSSCIITLDAPLAGPTATILVDGTLLESPATSAIDIFAGVDTSGFEPFGPRVGVDRSFSTVNLVLVDSTGIAQESTNWSVPAGDYDLSVTGSFDSGATSASATVTGASAPATPLASSAMGATLTNIVAITLWRARVTNIVVTEP